MICNSKLIVLMPFVGSIEWETQLAINELIRRKYDIAQIDGCTNIDVSRSKLASEAIRRGYTELLWIDSDVVFGIDDVERLRSHDLPVVCGIYSKKSSAGGLSIVVRDDTDCVIFGEGGGLLEIRWSGAGFLYTKLCVYEDIKRNLGLLDCTTGNGETFTPYFLPMIIKHPQEGIPLYLGEDVAFCERARQCGYKIYTDTTIRLSHIGKYKYQFEDIGGDRERFPSLTSSVGR